MLRFDMRFSVVATLASLALTIPASAQGKLEAGRDLDLQVRLARMNASPGPIDGKMGKNMQFAISAFQRMRGLAETGRADNPLIEELSPQAGDPTLVDYLITQKDVAGPFLQRVPARLDEMATLKHLSYASPIEALAEKFHMSEELLKQLNPRSRFGAGEKIRVVNLGKSALPPVKRVEVDKQAEAVWVFGAADRLIAAYPATIGSSETPSPEGGHKVISVTRNPTYVYDPAKLNFKGVKTTSKLVIPPGPNNPVGLVWIAVDAPSYGIHGSPQPGKIRRQESHGCVRLTNWDALQLASAVKKGVLVEFVDNAGPRTVGTGDSGRPAPKRRAKH
jgi:lipoprotein-anchoring transpeptidase ErfK/SrfK